MLEAGLLHENTSQNAAPRKAQVDLGLLYDANKELADFMMLDSDLWIFRRFDRLHIFNIIYLQQHLADLERRLNEVVPKNGTGFDKDELNLLMIDMGTTLQKYEDALSAQARHKVFPRPECAKVDLIRKYCLNKGLDVDRETILGGKDGDSDRVAIAAGEKGWIHRFIDSSPCLRKRFATDDTKDRLTRSILIYSEAKIRRVEKALISIAFCFFLLCPIVILSYLTSKVLKLLIVLTCILAISTLTIDLSESTSKTSVALVAGYSAVLVVFLSASPNL